MLTDLVEVVTTDEIPLHGAYFAPTVAARAVPIDCVCFFHGDTGNFYRSLYLELGARFAAHGIAFLSANRRGHDIVANGKRGGAPQGYAHESVAHACQDYAAWLELLRARGHRALALAGHSGGAVRAVYAQSKAHFTDVRAVLAVSPGEYDHQGLHELHGELFRTTYQQATTHVAQQQPDVYLHPGIPFGGTWTARAFVDCFHPDNRYSVSVHAAHTACPTLFVFGTEECAGPQELPLCGAAMRRLSAVPIPQVTVQAIAGANHGYEGRELELFECLHAWLRAVPR